MLFLLAISRKVRFVQAGDRSEFDHDDRSTSQIQAGIHKRKLLFSSQDVSSSQPADVPTAFIKNPEDLVKVPVAPIR